MDNFLSGIFINLRKGYIFEAVNFCDELGDVPIAQMTKKGILILPKGHARVGMEIENEGIRQQTKIEKGYNLIKTVVLLYPFLGLLGSLSGLAKFFFILNSTGRSAVNISDISYYVGESLLYVLITLTFSVIIYVFHNFLISLIASYLSDLSLAANKLQYFLTTENLDIDKIRDYIKPYDL